MQDGFLLSETARYSSRASMSLYTSLSKHLSSLKYDSFTGFSELNKSAGLNDPSITSLTQATYSQLRTCRKIAKDRLVVNFTPYDNTDSLKYAKGDLYPAFEPFTLPDGTEIPGKVFKKVAQQLPEVLFSPLKVTESVTSFSLQEIVLQAGTQIPNKDLRRLCFNNIICCGGLSRYRHFSSRLMNDLEVYKLGIGMPQMTTMNVLTAGIERAAEGRSGLSFDTGNLVWIGGSVVGSLPTLRDYLVTKEEYEEKGAHAFRIRCP